MGKKIAHMLVIISVALIAGCGGSGDDGAGSPTAFSVFPSERTINVKVADENASCGVGNVGEFLIVGGTAPYKLTNTNSVNIRTSTTKVGNEGSVFTVDYTSGACFEGSLIVIQDALGNTITLTLNSTKEVSTTTAAGAT